MAARPGVALHRSCKLLFPRQSFLLQLLLAERAKTNFHRSHITGRSRVTVSTGHGQRTWRPGSRSATALPNCCVIPTSPMATVTKQVDSHAKIAIPSNPAESVFQRSPTWCRTSSTESMPSQPSTVLTAPRTRASVPVEEVRSKPSKRIEFKRTSSEPSW